MFFALGKDTTIVFKQWKTDEVWGKNALMFYFVDMQLLASVLRNTVLKKLKYDISSKHFSCTISIRNHSAFRILLVRTAYHGIES